MRYPCLAARPLRVRERWTAELFGDYTPETMLIRAWMRTAVRGDCLSVVGVPGDEDADSSALAQLSSILPYGKLYKGMKIEISANERQCLAAVKCYVVPDRVSTLVTLRATNVAARLV